MSRLIATLLCWIALTGVARAESISLDPQEQAWLAQHPVLTLGIDPDHAPIEYVDDAGVYRGMVADYVALMEQRLGVIFEPQLGLSWRESVALGLAGKIDVFAAAGRTAERENRFLFTMPYAEIASVVVVPTEEKRILDVEDLRDLRVALVEGYAESRLLIDRLPRLSVLFKQTHLEALRSVSAGEAEATVLPLPIASYLIEQHGLTNLKIAGANPTRATRLHFMVPRDQALLAGILSRALASVTPQEHAEIQTRWFNVKYEVGLDPGEVRNTALGAVAVGLLVISAMAASSSWCVITAVSGPGVTSCSAR